jgi:hypothetical protein
LTKDDYAAKRKLLADKLKTLFEEDISDDEEFVKKLQNLE